LENFNSYLKSKTPHFCVRKHWNLLFVTHDRIWRFWIHIWNERSHIHERKNTITCYLPSMIQFGDFEFVFGIRDPTFMQRKTLELVICHLWYNLEILNSYLESKTPHYYMYMKKIKTNQPQIRGNFWHLSLVGRTRRSIHPFCSTIEFDPNAKSTLQILGYNVHFMNIRI